MNKLATFWATLKPKNKKIVVFVAIGSLTAILGTAVYVSQSRKQAAMNAVTTRTNTKPVVLDNKLLAQSQLLDAQKAAQTAKDELEALKKKEEEEKKAKAPGAAVPAVPSSELQPQPHQGSGQKMPGSSPQIDKFPPMPRRPSENPAPATYPTAPAASQNRPEIQTDSEIGGISLNVNEQKTDKETDKKKESQTTIYLAPSFMKATLLTGLYAPIGGDAKGQPVPMIIRVKAPAQLPNDVKASLQGCIVVADGKGNLATERADIVAVSLSCIDRKGDAVISEKIVGYVTGGDNIAGVKGKVVAKTGQMVARAAIAGAFGGAGDALKATSQTTSLSALGQVSQLDANKISQAAAGGAASEGFKELQKFYMELAHQSMPTIEILPSQPLYVVITKEVELHIKKLKRGSVH